MVEITREFAQADLRAVLKEALLRVLKKDFTPIELEDTYINVFQGGNYTAVVLNTSDRNYMGIAKRNPTDAYKAETGIRIAIHRAVRASIK